MWTNKRKTLQHQVNIGDILFQKKNDTASKMNGSKASSHKALHWEKQLTIDWSSSMTKLNVYQLDQYLMSFLCNNNTTQLMQLLCSDVFH